ncbi:helix-hairpin-helix domain-containing protein [Hydrotalea sp.]|uniref:helix-hairpin-helix domain-containing protein n=1 Tax=Hydrotalea sp. TaxID=2881279 RepID=UPI002617B44A|nr:helix-hairpin-helix domain-containing protein [Hydrotalea sp.]
MKKHYLYFSNRQTKGSIILLFLFVVVFSLPSFFQQVPDYLAVQTLPVANMEANVPDEASSTQPDDAPPSKTLQLFYFNPNTIDSISLEQMGLRHKLIQTLLHYRQKGGRFFKPEDIRKLWGLTPDEANTLMPFIQIHSPNYLAGNRRSGNILALHSIELNQANAATFRQIPGITPLLAYNMVQYREKLAGFVQMEQLQQIPGFSDSLYAAVLPYVYLNQQQIPKININKASSFALLHHPFIPENVAKAILILRQQKGTFQSVDELQKIPFVSTEMYRQISLFCTAE